MRGQDDGLRGCPTCGGSLEGSDIGIRDFSTWLFDALPGKAGGSDIDGVVERRGYFLSVEAKPSKWVPPGQKYMFDALCDLKHPSGEKAWTVYIVVDKDIAEDKLIVGRWIGGVGVQSWHIMSPDGLRQIARLWWEDADSR